MKSGDLVFKRWHQLGKHNRRMSDEVPLVDSRKLTPNNNTSYIH